MSAYENAAEIVAMHKELRYLRAEVARLQDIEQEYRDYVREELDGHMRMSARIIDAALTAAERQA